MLLGRFGPFLVLLGAIGALFGAALVIFWGPFGPFLVLLGTIGALFGAFGGDLCPFWCFWGRFGPFLVLLETLWALFDAALVLLGGI